MKTLKGTLVLGLLVTCGVGCDEEQPPYDGSPTLVLMPDTQCYTLFAPEVMEAQTRFIEEQLTSRNIVHMAHLGDITDRNSQEEWERAHHALAPLFGRLSMTLVSGNHDIELCWPAVRDVIRDDLVRRWAALFADADLTGASLLRVDAAGAVFDGAVAVGSRWGGSRLDGASMKKIDLTGARLTRCRIAGAALDGADLSETLLDESVLQGSSMVEATLEGARGVRVDLRDCDLTKLQAGDGLVLTESVLTGVKADGSVWDRARLDQCAFSFGKFTDATFSDASLVKARLDGCVLRGARFDRASMVGATMLKSDLLEARFEGADLSWCDLRGASLFRASLLRAKTEGAQWERADLTGTLLERTE